MHISPAWKHADTLEAFECGEGAERKKMSGSKCFSNGYRFNSMVCREGWEKRLFFFYLPISFSEHEKGIQKHITVLLCFAFLQFSALALAFSFPPTFSPREGLAKTAENLAWMKHSWVPLKRNKLTSDFSTQKAK